MVTWGGLHVKRIVGKGKGVRNGSGARRRGRWEGRFQNRTNSPVLCCDAPRDAEDLEYSVRHCLWKDLRRLLKPVKRQFYSV